MSAVLHAERLTPMGTETGGETRGEAIKRRMDALGISAGDLATEAGISRGQVYRVISDRENVTGRSYGACESALDRLEREHGHGGPDALLSTEAGLIEFGVDVDAIGVHVVVKGPVANAAELEASVARLIRDIRRSAGDSPDSPDS
jgi:transcriptional regulator with XRE-family HTH domain